MTPGRKKSSPNTRRCTKLSKNVDNSSVASRKRKMKRKTTILFSEGESTSAAEEGDPYSDVDGEYGSDGNYEPENGDNVSSCSDESLDIFPMPKKRHIPSDSENYSSSSEENYGKDIDVLVTPAKVHPRCHSEERRSSPAIAAGSTRSRHTSEERCSPATVASRTSRSRHTSEDHRNPATASSGSPRSRHTLQERCSPSPDSIRCSLSRHISEEHRSSPTDTAGCSRLCHTSEERHSPPIDATSSSRLRQTSEEHPSPSSTHRRPRSARNV